MNNENSLLEFTPVEFAKTDEPIELNDLSLALVGGGQLIVTF